MAENTYMELIDFRLYHKDSKGRVKDRIFGINVYKVREVIVKPGKIFRVPTEISFLEGMINLRGRVIPIINLQRKLGFNDEDFPAQYIIITEFNNLLSGF